MDLHGSRSPRTSLTSSPYSWLLFLGRSHWEGLPLAPLAWWLLQQLIDFWIFGGFWKVILGIPSRHHFFVSKQSHGHAWRLDDLGVPPHFRTPPFQTTKMNVGCTSNCGSWNGHWNHVKFGELKRGRSTKLSFNGKNIPFCHGTSNLWGQRTHVYKTPSLQFTHFFLASVGFQICSPSLGKSPTEEPVEDWVAQKLEAALQLQQAQARFWGAERAFQVTMGMTGDPWLETPSYLGMDQYL